MLLAAASFHVVAWAQETAPESENERRSRRPGDIVVTGRSLATDEVVSPLPVQVLAGEELVHRRQGGLGETLAGLPGIHLDNFGGGASRPVIRGQTLPRIEILSDGANLFDASSVSPDHAVSTDPLLLDAIEVQRGTAAIRYGGNAQNGAVNLIDNKVPKAVPEGGLTGATEVRYGTGDEEKTIVGRVTAGIGQFAIHAEGSRRRAGDYDVPAGYGSDRLRDSFANNSSYAFGASWVTSKGYIGAAYSRMDAEYGLPGHSHANEVCHTHGDPLLHCETHGSYTDPFEGIDDSHTAYIRLKSERVDVRADYDDLLPGLAHARMRLSYTDYKHDEIDGVVIPTSYYNETYDARLELTHKPLFGFTGTLGGQYTKTSFGGLDMNTGHIAGNYLYFEYESEQYGVFLTERRSFGPVDIELGARKDWRKAGLIKKQQIYKAFVPNKEHNPFSVSFGTTWHLDNDYSLGLNFARTQRAPNLRELYANGNNLATNSLEIGLTRPMSGLQGYYDQGDILETARSVDLTLRKTNGLTTFEIGAFYQDIDNYIFADMVDQDTGRGHLFLVYTAKDVEFYGIDGQVSHQVDATSRLTVFGDYVRAKLNDDQGNLPRISPGRLGARYNFDAGPLSAEAEYYHTFAQDKIVSYETRTGGYDMVNATLSYRLGIGEGDKSVEFYVRGTNLLNELAFAHTSFVKDQSPLRGRSLAFGMRHSL
ncbi:TonB-dependent receptor [Sphingobium yanoikuyae]|uniref:TonB-dependent receptor n=1 Tax=Sphingobium yanoikuyae TaxID=13690 RepID=UPI0035AEB8C7